jgi:hypothetical protein
MEWAAGAQGAVKMSMLQQQQYLTVPVSYVATAVEWRSRLTCDTNVTLNTQPAAGCRDLID